MYNQLLHVLYFCIFICILVIYVADHRFIPAVPLCSADRFFIRINKDIVFFPVQTRALVSKETVVLRWWGGETQNFGFIN